MTGRGLLLLDVDGPLNPYGAKPVRPDGYVTYRATEDGRWVEGDGPGHQVWLNPGHGALLRELAEETGLELVWATAWQHSANARVAPVIGLDPLPVIEFSAEDVHVAEDGWLTWRVEGGWKWPAVAAYAGGRALAWLDDELDEGAFAGAREVFDRERAGSPTLLCHVDPRFGLLGRHLEEIREWAGRLPSS